jgi:hypothetical protein
VQGTARQSYQNVSRETFWYDWREKILNAAYRGRLAEGRIAQKNVSLAIGGHGGTANCSLSSELALFDIGAA